MAKPLVFTFEGAEVSVEIDKVDRARLYGYVDTEALDDGGRACALATLAGDGHTVVGSGGTAIAYLSPAGQWRERTALTPVGPDGAVLVAVPSSFGAPITLDTTASVDDYLAHNVRAIYALALPEGGLRAKLAAGTLYTFAFSYRGGLEADTAFLLANAEGHPFMALGKPTTFTFIGLQELVVPDEPVASGDEDDDELDFGMM